MLTPTGEIINYFPPHDREQKPSKMVFFALKNDPTLMKVAKECPRPDCGGREARTLHQTKGDDTGLTQYNICCECGEEIS